MLTTYALLVWAGADAAPPPPPATGYRGGLMIGIGIGPTFGGSIVLALVSLADFFRRTG